MEVKKDLLNGFRTILSTIIDIPKHIKNHPKFYLFYLLHLGVIISISMHLKNNKFMLFIFLLYMYGVNAPLISSCAIKKTTLKIFMSSSVWQRYKNIFLQFTTIVVTFIWFFFSFLFVGMIIFILPNAIGAFFALASDGSSAMTILLLPYAFTIFLPISAIPAVVPLIMVKHIHLSFVETLEKIHSVIIRNLVITVPINIFHFSALLLLIYATEKSHSAPINICLLGIFFLIINFSYIILAKIYSKNA